MLNKQNDQTLLAILIIFSNTRSDKVRNQTIEELRNGKYRQPIELANMQDIKGVRGVIQKCLTIPEAT
jgi:hypothetical protein